MQSHPKLSIVFRIQYTLMTLCKKMRIKWIVIFASGLSVMASSCGLFVINRIPPMKRHAVRDVCATNITHNAPYYDE